MYLLLKFPIPVLRIKYLSRPLTALNKLCSCHFANEEATLSTCWIHQMKGDKRFSKLKVCPSGAKFHISLIPYFVTQLVNLSLSWFCIYMSREGLLLAISGFFPKYHCAVKIKHLFSHTFRRFQCHQTEQNRKGRMRKLYREVWGGRKAFYMRNMAKFQVTHWGDIQVTRNVINNSISPACIKNLCMCQWKRAAVTAEKNLSRRTGEADSGGRHRGKLKHVFHFAFTCQQTVGFNISQEPSFLAVSALYSCPFLRAMLVLEGGSA